MKWKSGSSQGQFVVGDEKTCKLNEPQAVIVDKASASLFISDYKNQRVIYWSDESHIYNKPTIQDVHSIGLTMDNAGFLYMVDQQDNVVKRYDPNEPNGVIVAGGNGSGNRLDQLSSPYFVCVDREQSVYVSDNGNHRIVKWEKGAKQGSIVVGGKRKGNHLAQLSHPMGIVVDQFDNLYIADQLNHRIVRWSRSAMQGTIIAGGQGEGRGSHQLNQPVGLALDQHGNLYVTDFNNHRVQKFSIS